MLSHWCDSLFAPSHSQRGQSDTSHTCTCGIQDASKMDDWDNPFASVRSDRGSSLLSFIEVIYWASYVSAPKKTSRELDTRLDICWPYCGEEFETFFCHVSIDLSDSHCGQCTGRRSKRPRLAFLVVTLGSSVTTVWNPCYCVSEVVNVQRVSLFRLRTMLGNL